MAGHLKSRLAAAFVTLLVAGASAAQERPGFPVAWEAPEELRILYEKHLPPPPAEAKEDRGVLRRWMREVRRRAPEIAAAEGWFAASVEVTQEEARVRVVVVPGERAKVESVKVEFRGDLAQDGSYRESRRAALEERWLLPAGATFRQSAWDEAKARLVEALTADDYAAGELVSSEARVDPATARVRITLVVDSGPAFTLGEVTVTGLARYSPKLVERILDIDPGEPYRGDRLLDLQRALQSTPWFANVVVEIERDRAHPVRVPVRVAILERPVADIGLSAGYGTDTGVRGEVSLRYRNVLDRGYDMHSALQADQKRQIGYADFYLPPRTVGFPVLGTVATKDSVGILAENESNQGLDTRRIAVAGYRQLVFERSDYRLGLSYQVEQSRTDGADWVLSRALAPVAEFTWRRVDDVLNPKSGGVLNVKLAGGARALLSDQNFFKAYAMYQHWLPLSPVDQLIFRAEGGRTFAPGRDGIPEDFLFRAGGSRSVRGYEYESLGPRENGAVVGGRYLLTGSAEYVRWFSKEWGGAVFLDVGDAADAQADLRANKGYGVGVRWRTPAGPLAVDVAYADRDRKARLVFSVAVAF
jgi:translocation and assembly module TamA